MCAGYRRELHQRLVFGRLMKDNRDLEFLQGELKSSADSNWTVCGQRAWRRQLFHRGSRGTFSGLFFPWARQVLSLALPLLSTSFTYLPGRMKVKTVFPLLHEQKGHSRPDRGFGQTTRIWSLGLEPCDATFHAICSDGAS